MERDAHLQNLFCITFIRLSRSPVHEPLSGSPTAPLWKEMPINRAFLYITFSIPNKGNPPSRFIAQSAHRERCSVSRALLQLSFRVPGEKTPLIVHLSLKVPSKWDPSMFHSRVPMERDDPSPQPMVYSFIYICRSPHLRCPPTKMRKTYAHHPWSSMQMEGLQTIGCGLVSQGDHLQHCYHYPSATQPSARYLPPWLG